MATPSKIHLTVDDTGIVFNKPQDEETAKKTSELLQENHDKYHIFFNQSGFHNHIVHHLLSLYGAGAPASVIESEYRANTGYQRSHVPSTERIVEDMGNPEQFQKFLGKEKYYSDFLIFWRKEIEEKGWENVLREYLFSSNERSDDLLARMYNGLLHPIIHLGFGVEFKQPAIIAEALAQACVHSTKLSSYLLKAEASSTSSSTKSLPELIDEIHAKSKHGDLSSEDELAFAQKYHVSEDQLEEKTAEMINTSIYFTAAAQHPPKQVKFDFFFIHSTNCSIFYPVFNAQSWLSTASKIRLLKFKVYADLHIYASGGAPPLLLEEIATYVPKKLEKGDSDWPGLFQRVFEFSDDGHVIKLVRAIRNGQLVSEKYEGKVEWDRVKGFMWEKIGNMAVDSIEDTGETWIRNAGSEEAWKPFEDRPRQQHL